MAASSVIMGLDAYASDDQASAVSGQGADATITEEVDADDLANTLDNVNISDSGSTSSGGVHVSHSDSASRRSSSIDSTASNNTISGAPMSNAFDNAVRNAVTTANAQFAPVIERAISDGMRMMREEMAHAMRTMREEMADSMRTMREEMADSMRIMREEMADSTFETNNKLEALDTQLDSIRSETNDKVEAFNTKLDGIITKEDAMGSQLDDLQQATSNTFVSVKTDINTPKHTVVNGKAAFKNILKAHEYFNAQLYSRSSATIMHQIGRHSRQIRERIEYERFHVESNANKHARDMYEVVDNIRIDRTKWPELNANLVRIHNRIDQQIARERDHVTAVAALGDRVVTKVDSFTRTVDLTALSSSQYVTQTNQWQLQALSNNDRYAQMMDRAGGIVQSYIEQGVGMITSASDLLQNTSASHGEQVKEISTAFKALNVKFDGLVERLVDGLVGPIQTNFRNDSDTLMVAMNGGIEECVRKVMLQQSRKLGVPAMFIQPEGGRDLDKIALVIDTRLTFDKKLVRKVVTAKAGRSLPTLLCTVWKVHFERKEPTLDKVASRCPQSGIILEESIWEGVDQVSFKIGEKDGEQLYPEWLSRNVTHGIKDNLRIEVVFTTIGSG